MTQDARMDGKTCIVTGANSGIGLATAQALAAKGASVVLICRNQDKGEAAVRTIASVTGNTPSLLLADLSDMGQVRRVAGEFLAQHDRLDVLLNNAGGYFPGRTESVDGWEMNFALNHMSCFVLTQTLRPALEGTPQSRVVCVASRAHSKAALDFEDLQWVKRRYKSYKVYGTSKLCNILFTRELARQLKGTDTTANCLHPGVVRTGFGKDYSSAFNLLTRLAAPLFMTPEKGALTSIYLSTSPEVSTVSGSYFHKCAPIEPQLPGQHDAIAARLWAVSEALAALNES